MGAQLLSLSSAFHEQTRWVRELPQMRHDTLGYFEKVFKEEGNVVRRRFLSQEIVYLYHPDDVQHVLAQNAQNYSKQTRGYDQLRTVLGNGLLTSEGSFWLKQRRLCQPIFARKRLAGFSQTMLEESEALANTLASREGAFDIAPDIMALTMRIATRSLLGSEVDDDALAVGQSLATVLGVFTENVASVIPRRWKVPTARNREAKRALRVVENTVERFIAARQKSDATSQSAEPKHHDLLQMFLEIRDEESGEKMSERQVRDEVMTLFLAGYETTANALLWTLVLLSENPLALQRVEDELDAVMAEGFDLAKVRSLKYLDAAIKESLRLRPPAWMQGRRAKADDLLPNTKIKKDTMVFVQQYITHRHPDFWESPNAFNPERFLEGGQEGQHKYAFFPFLGGPRQCIGKYFAELELRVILASLLHRYRFTVTHDVKADSNVTLRPAAGVSVRMSAR